MHTAAVDRRHTIARGDRNATASASGYESGGASASPEHHAESSTFCPASRHAYRSRGRTPCALAVSVVNVDGNELRISFMDTIHAQW